MISFLQAEISFLRVLIFSSCSSGVWILLIYIYIFRNFFAESFGGIHNHLSSYRASLLVVSSCWNFACKLWSDLPQQYCCWQHWCNRDKRCQLWHSCCFCCLSITTSMFLKNFIPLMFLRRALKLCVLYGSGLDKSGVLHFARDTL